MVLVRTIRQFGVVKSLETIMAIIKVTFRNSLRDVVFLGLSYEVFLRVENYKEFGCELYGYC